MLVEEEKLQAAKIEMIKKTGEKTRVNIGGSGEVERDLSTTEVCTFISFTLFLIICVLMQLRVN